MGATNKLTALRANALSAPGRHADGGGLYLRITPGGAKAWVFMFTRAGKRVEIGLGGYSSVPLAAARRIAAELREAVALGKDPRVILQPAAAAPPSVTFGAFADDYITSVEDGWKNDIHRQQWRNSLRDHAASLRDMPIEEVDTEAVLSVLQPIWLTKSETASRVRGRIEKVLAAAKARGLRPRDAMNPATWRGHLDVLLPRRLKLTRGHHPALPFKLAPAFMTQLRARPALAARCLEFTILTAARSGEALGATWGEIDLAHGLWHVPAIRMKAGADHTVPLSRAAVELLARLEPAARSGSELVFGLAGARRSNMAMSMLLRRMGQSEITVHGFRSTFRDWAGDATNYPRELVEQSLAHTIANKAERAYRRGTAIERRRPLMEDWGQFLAELDDPASVTNGQP